MHESLKVTYRNQALVCVARQRTLLLLPNLLIASKYGHNSLLLLAASCLFVLMFSNILIQASINPTPSVYFETVMVLSLGSGSGSGSGFQACLRAFCFSSRELAPDHGSLALHRHLQHQDYELALLT
jgi:hypothetical protein